MKKTSKKKRLAKKVRADMFSPQSILSFWSKVRITPTGCMEFTGGNRTGHTGYGCVEMSIDVPRSQKRVMAHRAAYAMTWGECPADKVLLHSCDNPKCIAPYHTSPGTQLENIQDMINKGRANYFGRRQDEQPSNV